MPMFLMTHGHVGVQVVYVDRSRAVSGYAVKFEFKVDPFCSPSPFSLDGFSLLTDPAGLLQAASQLACCG